MLGRPTSFWGKLEKDRESNVVTAWHPLEDHCADVAACAEALLQRSLIGKRLAALGGQEELDPHQVARLSVLAALHDVGKFNVGFQAKAAMEPTPTAGHTDVVAALLERGDATTDRFIQALDTKTWLELQWADDETLCELLLASVFHHGGPSASGFSPHWIWQPSGDLDPIAGIRSLSERLRAWFPLAYAPGGAPLPTSTAFQHAFAGLVMLADWLGSDPRTFTYSKEGDPDRMPFARQKASESLRFMGLDATEPRAALGAETPAFEKVFPFPPRGAQQIFASMRQPPSSASLTILEAETGAGKTEAALYRFVTLFHQGAVDGMYFALPTRSAATQIYRRVLEAVEAIFPKEARPPVVLAVPGYLEVDGIKGSRDPLLGPFEVLWNDDDRFRFRAWAAENTKRYLAAAIAVGTVDQALLSSLRVSHSHLRASSLLRQLLVVDEVHASDHYMTRILESVLERHIAAGGHALLMSATLGAAARHRFLDPKHSTPLSDLQDAVEVAYPAISLREGDATSLHAVPSPARRKELRVEAWPAMDAPEEIAERAIEAAEQGAKVLIIRNTVQACMDTQLAIEAAGGEAWLMRCRGVTAPHHSRFARRDRIALDDAIEAAFGKERVPGGTIAVATQTVQQSLDLDADWLVSDLCPIDVLLQRFGRLHRHVRNDRPASFVSPRASVLVPAERDLSLCIRSRGKALGRHGIGTVYEDLRILEATWRQIESRSAWTIPTDNRSLVEAATHPAALSSIVEELGGKWAEHEQHVLGQNASERSVAHYATVHWHTPFRDQPIGRVSSEDERIATRLGEGDRRVVFSSAFPGPFSESIAELRMPAHFAKDAPADAVPEAVEIGADQIRFVFGGTRYQYDRLGLRPLATTPEDDRADA